MKKILQILKNPFATISDKKQTMIGLFSFILGIIISNFMQMKIEIIGINSVSNYKMSDIIINQSINIFILTLVLYGLGKFINKKTRIIDILNSVLLALIPLYISLFQNTNNFVVNEGRKVFTAIENKAIYQYKPSVLFLFTTIIVIALIVYYIYLLFIGFKTATNAKKTGHYILFFILFIITDLLTSALINSI
ncbi:hypothetical protein NU10_05290 [Flavobacterium dauae]|uniref:hypothetical protein n=1 Tax=Flavobacterium dauae TaxID=1563479 RepID=UPI00101B29E6|nr:hypothetical protein [Flavobacterium dauae]WLD24794.1 hypothetical protein NU10_05290 [Flavobacterium dauae]